MSHSTPQRPRPIQARSIETRQRITAGALAVLAEGGVPGLTHRAVARAAGVSLAATTYHFATKADILAEASKALLDGYLAAFARMEVRLLRGEETGIRTLADLERRLVRNALGRERARSLAWCELILHACRSEAGRALAQDWYRRLDVIWQAIAGHLGAADPAAEARIAIDRVAGLTFLLHAFAPTPEQLADLLAGRLSLGQLVPPAGRSGAEDPDRPMPAARLRVLDAAIGLLIDEGAAGVTYRAVADRAGMVRSGPSYHFPSIDILLDAAQTELTQRAKLRYRAGLGAIAPGDIDAGRLVDLTTAIFFREALEYPRENVGLYSVWLRAAQSPALRASVGAALAEMDSAWQRRIASIGGDRCAPQAALILQALFVGKLIRAVAAGTGMAELARARDGFARAVQEARDGAAT